MNNKKLELFSLLYDKYTNKDDLYEDLINMNFSVEDLRMLSKGINETINTKFEEFLKRKQDQLRKAIESSAKSLYLLQEQLIKYTID